MAQTAADILVEVLQDWGVDTVFGLPGDGINGIMSELLLMITTSICSRLTSPPLPAPVGRRGLPSMIRPSAVPSWIRH